MNMKIHLYFKQLLDERAALDARIAATELVMREIGVKIPYAIRHFTISAEASAKFGSSCKASSKKPFSASHRANIARAQKKRWRLAKAAGKKTLIK